MKISVIIPIYKVEKYLHECVDSILNQTFKDFEVILVDDGSPDSCPQICEEYARIDDRVKVIHQKNQGLSCARNSGLRCAKGDYICFIDGDDFLINDSVFQRLREKTESNPDIVNYKFREWFEIDGHIGECRFDYNVGQEIETVTDIYCDLIDKDAYYNSAWSKIIRRDLLIDNNIEFEKGIVGEDNDWFYNVVMVAKKVVLIDEPLYVYRRRSGSITTSTTRKNLVDQIYVLNKWLKKVEENKDDKRTNVILGSLAKQYCSALIIYAGLVDVEDLYPELKKRSFLLNYTKTKRVVIFRMAKRLLGLKGVIRLLRFANKVR